MDIFYVIPLIRYNRDKMYKSLACESTPILNLVLLDRRIVSESMIVDRQWLLVAVE
jgi:hypothetical protein